MSAAKKRKPRKMTMTFGSDVLLTICAGYAVVAVVIVFLSYLKRPE